MNDYFDEVVLELETAKEACREAVKFIDSLAVERDRTEKETKLREKLMKAITGEK